MQSVSTESQLQRHVTPGAPGCCVQTWNPLRATPKRSGAGDLATRSAWGCAGVRQVVDTMTLSG
jgi:hypothetical protein